MIRRPFLITFLFASLYLLAQDHYTCNSQRYRLAVFENVQVTEEVRYSAGETIGGNTKELYMDIYEPIGDTVSRRPLVVLAFGGSFVAGSREEISELCELYALRGFVAVSIDYRLYDLPFIPLPTEPEMQDVVVRAVKDMKSALNFLDSTASADNPYRIDMDWVYVGGVSSGSITACHAAMLDSTDLFSPGLQAALEKHAPIDGITTSQSLVDIKGVINYSGALHDLSWMDSNDPPIVSFHETGDPTVPYKDGSAQIFGQDIIALSGSFSIDSVARSLGVISELISFDRSSHVAYFFNEEETKEVLDASGLFLFDMLCSETADLVKPIVHTPYSFGPNPSKDQITVRVNGDAAMAITDLTGRIIEEKSFSRSSTLFLSKLAPGTYILTIRIGENVYTERVVKE